MEYVIIFFVVYPNWVDCRIVNLNRLTWMIYDKFERISQAVAALTEFIRDSLYSDDVLFEMGRQLLARLDQEEP